MAPQKVTSFLEQQCQCRDGALYNKTAERRARTMLPAQILGHHVEMDSILEVASKYDWTVIRMLRRV